MKLKRSFFYVVLLTLGFHLAIPLFFASRLEAQITPASLYVAPSSGTFTVGSTFVVSIFVNTGGQVINAVQADLKFPSDKLQVVSPSAGKSFVGIWVVQPTYDNRGGTTKFQGAIPTPGVNTSAGLISEVTFRVIAVGTAILRFEDSSRVLLNDGRGTDVLGQTTGGVFNLALPPPAGPPVSSPTHQDQEKWHASRSVTLEWGSDEPIEGYSYILSDQPIEIPDDISEGFKTTQAYKDLSDDIHYFHIKSLRDGRWGGVTHFSIKIDGTAPAGFTIEVAPNPRTRVKRPVITFQTTDGLSGVDHYELKIIPLNLQGVPTGVSASQQAFFIEASSPYIPELNFGEYDVFIRAYDKAGNNVQEIQRLVITTAAAEVVGLDGLRITENILIPWWVLWSTGIMGIFGAFAFAYQIRRWHRHVEKQHELGELPSDVKKKLEEFKELRERYKGILSLMLVVTASLFLVAPFGRAVAQNANFPSASSEKAEISPPIVTEFSKNITNQEIFYIGGKTVLPESGIMIFLQRLETGETFSQSITSDKKGDWFYTHPRFLGSGKYLLWTQARVEGAQSPPSAQMTMTVATAALQLGASRLSYEIIFLGVSIALFGVIILIAIVGIYHYYHGRKKHERLREEVRRAEESIRRGFAVLHRDIKAELGLLQKAKLSKELSREERELEEKIIKDLEAVKSFIGKEIWELEQEI